MSDVRQVDRLVMVARAMAESPGASLPQMFARASDLTTAYRLFKNAESTPDQLQAGHRELVLLEMEKPGIYLLIEDSSEIFCSKESEIEGLGPVGPSKGRQMGFHLHSVLCVRWLEGGEDEAPQRPAVEVVGLADQQFHIRQPRPSTSKVKRQGSERRTMPSAGLESGLWEGSVQRIGEAPDKEDITWVKVADRGADIFDHLNECQQQRLHFVIRANSDRVLISTTGEASKLFAAARASSGLGELKLELRGRPGKPARQARLQVSLTNVLLRSPETVGHGRGTRPPIACAAVRVWEPNPPAGSEALEWILLTDLPLIDFAQAREIVQMYAARWLIEEFHKALKTGMGVERLQLTSARGWLAATAMMSIVALRLLRLREQVRRQPDAPAKATDLSDLELDVLRARTGRSLSTSREVALAIGRLGGHLNRKLDGLPGWITLWRGWRVLRTLVEGVLLARKLTNSV